MDICQSIVDKEVEYQLARRCRNRTDDPLVYSLTSRPSCQTVSNAFFCVKWSDTHVIFIFIFIFLLSSELPPGKRRQLSKWGYTLLSLSLSKCYSSQCHYPQPRHSLLWPRQGATDIIIITRWCGGPGQYLAKELKLGRMVDPLRL